MKNKKKMKKESVQPEINEELYPDISDTVSSTECTGMMFAPPRSEDEYESYQELYKMQVPKRNYSKKPK